MSVKPPLRSLREAEQVIVNYLTVHPDFFSGWLGLLAIGGRDERRFHPGMGTLILRCLSKLISHALQAYIRHTGAASPYRASGEGGD